MQNEKCKMKNVGSATLLYMLRYFSTIHFHGSLLLNLKTPLVQNTRGVFGYEQTHKFATIINLMKLRELRTEVVQKYYESEQTRKFANLITNFYCSVGVNLNLITCFNSVKEFFAEAVNRGHGSVCPYRTQYATCCCK